jgi:hypothetical protein
MSVPLPLKTPAIELTRTGVLAAASIVVATCSVAVTLAVADGGGGADEPAAAKPGTAEPDAATPYHHRAMERRR